MQQRFEGPTNPANARSLVLTGALDRGLMAIERRAGSPRWVVAIGSEVPKDVSPLILGWAGRARRHADAAEYVSAFEAWKEAHQLDQLSRATVAEARVLAFQATEAARQARQKAAAAARAARMSSLASDSARARRQSAEEWIPGYVAEAKALRGRRRSAEFPLSAIVRVLLANHPDCPVGDRQLTRYLRAAGLK